MDECDRQAAGSEPMRKRKDKTEGWKAPATFAEYVAANPNGNVRWLRSHYSPNAPGNRKR